MRFVSWNVNGLRACVGKGFMDYFKQIDADVFCIQETKLQEGQIELDLGGEYHDYWNYALKKGYSGTAVFTKKEPLSVRYGIEEDSEDEGRIITLEYEHFYLVNVYTPNSQRDLARLPYRLELGRSVPRLPAAARCGQTRHRVWRFECGLPGNRSEESQIQ